MRVQLRLSTLGLFNGSIDGAFGSDTKGALMLFQEQHGLHTDGRMTTATLNALGVPAAR
jgi:peptidoglycan hydrolase-like protein with peptidoglycan-binding domain